MKKHTPTLVLACLMATPAAQAAMAWHWNATPSAYGDQITASMDQCVATFNAYSNYDYSIGVVYSSGTPTADAGYLGQIRFGGSRNYRVAMHEASHWLGTGTVADWSPHYRFGQWKGTYAYNLRCAFDGPGERMGGDAAHYWPYGANQDSEGVDGPRMVGVGEVNAFGDLLPRLTHRGDSAYAAIFKAARCGTGISARTFAPPSSERNTDTNVRAPYHARRCLV